MIEALVRDQSVFMQFISPQKTWQLSWTLLTLARYTPPNHFKFASGAQQERTFLVLPYAEG
jgi:hypothetical protein